MPETGRVFDAIGPAQNVADGLDKARRRPQADDCTEPQQPAGAALEHFRNWRGKHTGDVGGQPAEDRLDGKRRILGLAKKAGDGGGQDEKGK